MRMFISALLLTLITATQTQAAMQDDIRGIWLLDSIVSLKDGKGVDFIQGRDARGMLVFDRQRFSLQILVDLPKIAANDRAKTTPAEDHAIARGTLSYFGAYSVSETDRLLSFFIERSTFPNQNGQERKRLITSLTKDELKFSNPNAAGGTNDTFTWKRAP